MMSRASAIAMRSFQLGSFVGADEDCCGMLPLSPLDSKSARSCRRVAAA
jgi:hypothetical protein